MSSHKQAVTVALIARWSALLAHATRTARAASLLCEDTSSHNTVGGFLPPPNEFFAHMPREPAAPSNEMSFLLVSLQATGERTWYLANVCHLACLFKKKHREEFFQPATRPWCMHLTSGIETQDQSGGNPGITRNIFDIPSCHEVKVLQGKWLAEQRDVKKRTYLEELLD